MSVCENCGKEFYGSFCPDCGAKAEGVVFRNQTKIDLECNLRITESITGKKGKIFMLIGAVILLICGSVVLALYYLLPDGEDSDLFFSIFCFVLGVFFGVFGLAYKAIMRAILKKNMLGKESTNAYTFTEDGYEVMTKISDGTQSTASGGYAGFVRAKEYKDMWLLYINNEKVFAVEKSGMTEGSAEELSALFTRVMAGRYKICYKKQ